MAEGKTAAKAATKSQMYQTLADASGLTRKQVTGLFDALTKYIQSNIGKKGPGVVVFSGLMKIKRVQKPATKARPGINPATKEPIMIAAKPARTVVKVVALKNLKEMVK